MRILRGIILLTPPRGIILLTPPKGEQIEYMMGDIPPIPTKRNSLGASLGASLVTVRIPPGTTLRSYTDDNYRTRPWLLVHKSRDALV